MTRTTERDDEPEPGAPTRRGRLWVPVRTAAGGGAVVRLFRTPLGERTAVAFTGPERLVAALGAGHGWVTLGEPALRALVAPLGVEALCVDPALTASAPAPVAERAPRVRPLAGASR
ncbi:hypothetical protein FH609_001120 [Streptomyces sp. 3MP-14]|uniref:SseB family protein n=1 Tax=Streptomyces mimosae TaxID=2586635 RepID=A0A5N6ATH1_9ACTN|nr:MULTISPECIES: SAV_915 family protein [Streptomyces]KAB8171008.1 hypothetical protein FH607_001350 [Streptomyces mimosae]KAB8179641.1 hypothetical protein FH609_001120 [Streptomyces sp. 3MP-14]